MIPFNQPPVVGTELGYIAQAVNDQHKLGGDGPFNKKCQLWLQSRFGAKKVLMAPSGTGALDFAALVLDIQPGDEVIMPSYTFVSSASAFVLRGAQIVFVDIHPDTMNIDESLIEAAITERTKAVVPVHYAGVGCDMDAIMGIAERNELFVVEDAAQCVMASWRGRALGTIGHLGCYSFHETKNYTSGGEGGALLVNDAAFIENAEMIQQKGTNRSQFLRGEVDKYTWQRLGSSFLTSEVQAAYLRAQLDRAEAIDRRRQQVWNRYHEAFAGIENDGLVRRTVVPPGCRHNAHIYFLKLPSQDGAIRFVDAMKARGVAASPHYVPLHSSPGGRRYGRFCGEDRFTTQESAKLVRLPLWFNMSDGDADRVIEATLQAAREAA